MHALEFSPAARRDLGKIPRERAGQILNDLGALTSLPNPLSSASVRKLRVPGNYHRVRSGDFRAVIKLAGKSIRVIRIFNRKDMERMLASIWN